MSALGGQNRMESDYYNCSIYVQLEQDEIEHFALVGPIGRP